MCRELHIWRRFRLTPGAAKSTASPKNRFKHTAPGVNHEQTAHSEFHPGWLSTPGNQAPWIGSAVQETSQQQIHRDKNPWRLSCAKCLPSLPAWNLAPVEQCWRFEKGGQGGWIHLIWAWSVTRVLFWHPGCTKINQTILKLGAVCWPVNGWSKSDFGRFFSLPCQGLSLFGSPVGI